MLTWNEKNELIGNLHDVLADIHIARKVTRGDVEKVALILSSMEQNEFFLCEDDAKEAEETKSRIYDWAYAYDMAWEAIYEPVENVLGFMWRH